MPASPYSLFGIPNDKYYKANTKLKKDYGKEIFELSPSPQNGIIEELQNMKKNISHRRILAIANGRDIKKERFKNKTRSRTKQLAGSGVNFIAFKDLVPHKLKKRIYYKRA